jgi:hypothetical protein
MPDVAHLRTLQDGIAGHVTDDLTAFWGSLDLDHPEAARDALLTFVPQLVTSYGEGAASVAADWYDDERAKAVRGSRFRAIAAPATKPDLMQAQVRFGASHLFTLNADQTLAFLLGSAQKYTLAPARATVAQSAIADPAARGWQRVTAGGCDFCVMLAGRGAVYTEATADFEAHGHCHCAAVPAWS